MVDIDRIIEKLLGDRRIREGAAFSTRSYSDQPLIERGRDLKKRIEQREAERAERRQREAEARKAERDNRHDNRTQQSSWMTRKQYQDLVSSIQQQEQRLQQIRQTGTPAASVAREDEQLPERIREMRRLERGGMPATLSYGSSTASELFWQQAQMMADYEDDYDFRGSFSQYYPTYSAMSNRQLRGYFSWRTRVRAGQVDPAPLSFAFVYVYELLMDIGTTPGSECLATLRSFGKAYREADEMLGQRLSGYLRRWCNDYVIYHDLSNELAPTVGEELGRSVLVLLRAEHALLHKAQTEPRIPNPSADGPMPTREQLFDALGTAGRYHITHSRLVKDEPELVAACACDVFAALVSHCAKRRKTDFVEGLFGYATEVPYTMFSAAVFYEPSPHPDCEVRSGELATYICTNGRWRQRLACDVRDTSRDLGLAMHCCDYELRRQLDYPYPLKERKAPKYLWKIVQDVVAARLEKRAEAESRRITIDRSKLGTIRAAAAVTREALLTDEDRELPQTLEPEPPAIAPIGDPAPSSVQAQPNGQLELMTEDFGQIVDTTIPAVDAAPETPAMDTIPTPSVPSMDAAPVAPSDSGILTPLETRFLAGLMDGTPVAQLLSPTDPFPSVVADSINDKFFDIVGDAVIEWDADEPIIIEDYLDDIREVL